MTSEQTPPQYPSEPGQLFDWEKEVICRLSTMNASRGPDLLSQVAGLRVKSREDTGAGSYAYFQNSFASNSQADHVLSGCYGAFREDDPKVGFVLYIDNGLITVLECHAFSDDWPIAMNELTIYS